MSIFEKIYVDLQYILSGFASHTPLILEQYSPVGYVTQVTLTMRMRHLAGAIRPNARHGQLMRRSGEAPIAAPPTHQRTDQWHTGGSTVCGILWELWFGNYRGSPHDLNYTDFPLTWLSSDGTGAAVVLFFFGTPNPKKRFLCGGWIPVASSDL